MPTNTAAWIRTEHGRLEVGPAPYPSPDADQVVVRNHAVAVNPLEWVIQATGRLSYRWLTYPTVIGSDVAGEVVEVGSAVTRLRVGDRVLAHAVGTDKDAGGAAEGGFQHYTVVLERMAAPIPDTMPFEDATVLPLAVSTAACGLFQADHLGLRLPSADAPPTGETVLVWGGSTSVGSNAIQLAVAAGYEVVTTASPRNADYVRSLGAGEVLDHHSPTAVADVVAALEGRTLAGTIAIGTTSAAACVDIAGASRGSRAVAFASTPVSFARLADPDHSRLELPRTVLRLAAAMTALVARSLLRRARATFIFGTTVKDNEVGTAIYRDFLPAALADGRYVAAPRPTVVGTGLQDIQEALDIQRRGVSAAKVVVTLAEQ